MLHVNNLVLVFFKIRVMYCKAFVYTPLLCSLVIFNVAFNPPPKYIVVLALSVGPKPFRPSVLPSVRPSVRNVYSVRMLILVMDFQILLSPAEYFEGDIVCGVVCPSFLFPSVRPAMDYGKLTKGALWSHLPPTTDQVGKLSVVWKDLKKALVMAPR